MVWEVTIDVPYNPLNYGDVAWVYLELQTNSGTYVLYDTDEMDYDALSSSQMVYTVSKNKLKGVTNGGLTTVCIYVNGTPALDCPARVTEKAAQ
jgi:hypothetical protein